MVESLDVPEKVVKWACRKGRKGKKAGSDGQIWVAGVLCRQLALNGLVGKQTNYPSLQTLQAICPDTALDEYLSELHACP